MCKRGMAILLLSALCIFPLLLVGCDDDPGPFALNGCRLNDPDCQLQ